MKTLLSFISCLALCAEPAIADPNIEDGWVEVMNACETLISNQSLDGFAGFSTTTSTLNVAPKFERAFQHPDFQLVASTVFDGQEWVFCAITGETKSRIGHVVGLVTGTLAAQIRDQDDQSLVIKGSKVFAPVRVICRDAGQVTSIFAYYGDGTDFRISVASSLPEGLPNPCM